MIYEEVKLPNPGILKTKIPDNVFQQIKSDALDDAQNQIPYNKNLVGQIKGEYEIRLTPDLQKVVNNMWIKYREAFDFSLDKQYNIPETAWINFQQKYEFNPVHHHDGAVAWVIWLTIPYDLDEELSVFPDSKNKSASLFYFYYNSLIGQQNGHPLMIDKSWEGNMVMFPALLQHSVNPFYTTDEVRISIAGNIHTYD